MVAGGKLFHALQSIYTTTTAEVVNGRQLSTAKSSINRAGRQSGNKKRDPAFFVIALYLWLLEEKISGSLSRYFFTSVVHDEPDFAKRKYNQHSQQKESKSRKKI